MIDPPQVLLEQSFLRAVVHTELPDHELAAALYLDLVDQYEANELLLVAVSSHLDPYRSITHHGVFAPVDRLWVGGQHRRAAQRLATDGGYPLDIALTMVMAERHRVPRLATFEPVFQQFRLELLPDAGSVPSNARMHD